MTWRTFWRRYLGPIVAELRPNMSRTEKRFVLRDTYNTAKRPREGWAYRTWCQEVWAAIGIDKQKRRRRRRRDLKGQGQLFKVAL